MTDNSTAPITSPDTYLEVSPYDADRGEKVGVNPASLSKREILDLGHPPSPIKAIRAKCLDCCGGVISEVRKCTALGCALWPLRMGKNVYHARATRSKGGDDA
ncbi:hypothetical protein GCM10007853_30100 [Algimonas ampicilliniresistens]|uniref:Uncharacterized protein n=1 Tax=Algimonas ampicilliniresistens TaxID=1298735 RepID=A0ABQ5VC80_9PROT|nr:hypothetical protein GCM10007853_30100 [Algimonas ampicilliniresistens]